MDRSIDPISPVLHDISYASLLADLLDVSDGKYTPDNSKKPIILNDQDLVWSDIRYLHIADAMDYLKNKVDSLNESTVGKYEAGNHHDTIQVNTLREVVPRQAR